MIEDKWLVWKLKCGNRAALCHIYKKYKNDLLKLALVLSNDRSIAEDVVHDVFVSFAQFAEAIIAYALMAFLFAVEYRSLQPATNR